MGFAEWCTAVSVNCRRKARRIILRACSVRLRTTPTLWSSIRFLAADQDWRGYEALAFDIFNPAAPFDLALRIDDADSIANDRDRYHAAIPLASGWTHASIPLEKIAAGPVGRKLRLDAIRRVIFFLDTQPEPRTFYLDHVRLEKTAAH